MRSGGRSDRAPGRGGLRRRGGMNMCYREEGVEEIIGERDVDDTDGEVVAVRMK